MEKRLEGPGAAPRIVEVMYFKGIPKQVSQQPNMGIPQQWEAQWQEFLRMIQPAHAVQGNPQPTDAVPWDDAKAFLDAFEQVAEACRWPREEWVGRLVPALRGGVEQYICQLDPQDRLDYLKVKAAILRSDTFRSELKRQHFRHCSYQEREGPRRAYNQLQELCRQWLKPDRHTKEQILELIIQEQLLATLPSELQSWLRECGPENCIEMVALAEDFLMGHRQARMWDRQIAVPERIAGSLEADRLPRQQHGGVACQGNREIGNEMTPTRNSSVGLPSGEQPTAEVGITTESVAVKEELNLNPNPNPWELTQGSSGGTSSASGHLNPLSEATDQPDRQALFTPSPEPGESVASTFLGDRLLSDIKTEDTEDSDMDNAYEPFPEDFPDASSLGPQVGQLPSGGLDGASPRQGQKALKKKGGKIYPPEKRHVCSDCGFRAYYRSDILRHMNKHSKEVYECLECGKTFKGLLAFENHQKTHDTSGDLSTTKKGQKSTTSSPQAQEDSEATPVSPAEHTEVPSEDKPYRCNECGKDFKWQSCLSRHKRLHKYGRIPPLRSRDVPEPQDTNSESSKDCKEVLSLHPATYEPESISRLRPRKPEESGAPPLQRGIKTLRVVLTKLANNRSGKVHRCPECGYKTNWLSVLVNHMRVHTKERPYTCKGCGKDFRYSSSLSKHQKYTCSESLLAEGDSLAEHLQTYGEDEALRRMTTSQQEKIGSEVSSSVPETETKGAPSKKIHPCSKCEYRAESFADLIKHLRIHIGEKPYQCHTCGKAFDSPSSFAKHLQTHKNAGPNSTGPDAATPTVAECDVTLSDDEELINILAKKSGKSGRAGGKVSKAKAHQKVAGRKRSNAESPTDAEEAKKSRYNKLERKHKCPDCPHRSYYLSDLLKHQRVHTRAKPYKCPDCGKSFTSKSAVTSHQKQCSRPDQKNPEEQNKKKGKRKYTCSRCGHKTYKLSSLLVHLRLHLSEKPFKCQECGEAFAQSSNLAEHMSSVHTAAEDGGSQQTPPSNPPETTTGNEMLPLMNVKEEELELEITPEGNYQTLSVTPKENSAITTLSQRWRYSKEEKQKEPEVGFQLREPKTEEDEVPLDRLAVPIKEEPMEEPVVAVQPQQEVTTEKPKDDPVRKEVSVRAMLEKFAYYKTRETSPEKPETSPAAQEEEKLPSKEVKLPSKEVKLPSKEIKLPSKEVKLPSKEVTGRESRREGNPPAEAEDTNVGSILCDQCGEGFLRDSELVRHQLTSHWD